ncbi:hypothetical protein C0992_012874 [Termitomyces sp. T32_za158]|nr:hypothetical protein C0992_012874 [Termitomyces sp. T32_za158]
MHPNSLFHKRRDVQPSKAPRDMKKDQTRLSENMELLELFRYRDPSKNLSNTTTFPYNREVLHILDMISTCFATGQEGDVIATMVVIRKETQKALFYLASNRSGKPSVQQTDAVLRFQNTLAHARTYEDLIPFVARYSSQNVMKRVSKLRAGFDNLFSSRKIVSAIRDIDTNHVFFNLLTVCHQMITSTPEEGNYRLLETSTSCRKLVRLIETSRNLEKDDDTWNHLYMRIEEKDIDLPTLGSTDLVECAKTLHRRLCKISQYRVLENLIKFVKSHKDFNFQWVPDLFLPGRTGEMTIKPQPLERIARSRVDELLIQQKPKRRSEYDHFVGQARARLSKENGGKWPKEFATNVHCEIRIIRYCMERFEKGTFIPDELIIGTSKRCCLFCDEWINRFNKISGLNFMTGGSHGKAYRRAALTGVEKAEWIGADTSLMQGIDQHVMNCIRLNIKTHRPKLLAPSDEYASSMEDCPDFTDKRYSMGYTALVAHAD